jgi:hypothetical protein
MYNFNEIDEQGGQVPGLDRFKNGLKFREEEEERLTKKILNF